ncbi:MAG TPA: tRNA (N6-isopentenyl adenosine(37)-C2)-methylthiotransferase MiaB [Blastocatellia bacterium]|nr:tRNA (N6-isopentenyl adenosine(37)-C2)-methylthiotransferase MiaB [Blastocatellia bacterium]
MRAHLVTFGCQMNEYDTHAIQSELAGIGCSFVDDFREADLVLVNTCAVRGKPVEKVQTLLGELRKEKRRRDGRYTIGLMGCLAQLPEGRRLGKKFGVDIMLGPGAITKIVPAIQQGRFQSFQFDDELRFYTPPPPQGVVTANVTIMRGCNHRCTYCVVPMTRGPEVSRPVEDIIAETRKLAEAGVFEVTLLGQNVNSFGLAPGTGSRRPLLPGYASFGNLLRMVGRVGIPRVRFVTSHPINFDDEIIESIADTPAVCRYIHLPVQSGCDRVLKRMAREYTRQFYLNRIERIRKLLPDATISTDIIVGFPGETDEDFEETLSLYREVRYDAAYMFIYSEREGTPAANHFEDVPREVKTTRLSRLVELQKQVSLEENQKWLGREVEVLVKGPADEAGFVQGHTRGNHVAMIRARLTPGIHRVKVAHATPNRLYCTTDNSSPVEAVPSTALYQVTRRGGSEGAKGDAEMRG